MTDLEKALSEGGTEVTDEQKAVQAGGKVLDPRFVDDEPPSRTFNNTGPDLVGQLQQIRAQVEAQPTTSQRLLNVGGNAMTFGAGPAIDAAATKLGSLVPGAAPVDYNATRQANQEKLEADRAALGPVATMATETVGGLVPALVAPEVEAAQALSPVARGIATGGAYGATQALGETASHGDWENLGKNLAVGAGAGAATGGVLEGGANAVVARAAKNAAKGTDDWLVTDILGNDAKTQATPTTRKVLAEDAADLAYTTSKDPTLRRSIDKARGGDPERLQALKQQIDDRLDNTFGPRASRYAALDEELPHGGARVGDFVDAVEEANKGNMRTGFKKERAALADAAQSLKQFEGAETVIDPNAEIAPGLPASQFVKAKEAELARTTDPGARSTIEKDLAHLHQTYGQTVYNPNKIVPTEDMRTVLTRLQGEVRDAMGGLNEKQSYRRAREVVAPIWEAFNAHLNSGPPDLVSQIRDMNRRGSALLNMQDVVDQRLNRATQQNLAVQKAPSGIRATARRIGGAGGAAMLLATGQPKMAALMAGAAAAPELARGADRALTRLILAKKAGSVTAELISNAINQGVPRAVALGVAGSATHGAISEDLPH